MLRSMPSCLINSSTISLKPFCTAQINAVELNVRVKSHKYFNCSIQLKKLDLNFMNIFDLKCLEC